MLDSISKNIHFLRDEKCTQTYLACKELHKDSAQKSNNKYKQIATLHNPFSSHSTIPSIYTIELLQSS